MENLYSRSVFFVKNAEESLAFYTEALGFKLNWNHQEEGRAFVFQVSLFGFELILNQIEDWTKERAGHSRVFIGLDDNQVAPLRQHISARGIKATLRDWGKPTLVIRDLDGNELFFWPPQSEWAGLESELADDRLARNGSQVS
jgi:catechol 2,3-dioxygenase-like lactoylglutathione lyase family enzyme